MSLTSCQRTKNNSPYSSNVSTLFHSGEGKGRGAVCSYTPIKNQGKVSACWIYAYLACIETERIEQYGDSLNLSPLWLIENAMHEQAVTRYLSKGKRKITCRGIGPEAERLMQEHGMVPYSFFHYDHNMSGGMMERDIAHKVDIAIRTKKGIEALHDDVAESMPHKPHNLEHGFYLYGMHYTPQEFGNSLLAGTSMQWLTSYTHHPFHKSFDIELPDNNHHHLIMNVPIDSLYSAVITALQHRHAVFWEGKMPKEMATCSSQVTAKNKAAMLPTTLTTDAATIQQARQRAFERFEVTDDHAMAIIGLTIDKHGNAVFICKNSWGKEWGYQGFCLMKAEDFLLNTVLVGVMNN